MKTIGCREMDASGSRMSLFVFERRWPISGSEHGYAHNGWMNAHTSPQPSQAWSIVGLHSKRGLVPSEFHYAELPFSLASWARPTEDGSHARCQRQDARPLESIYRSGEATAEFQERVLARWPREGFQHDLEWPDFGSRQPSVDVSDSQSPEFRHSGTGLWGGPP